jgi:hypothetical protein
MRNLLRAIVLLPALALVACDGGGDDDQGAPAAQLGEAFELRYGQSIDVGPITLKFIAVAEESRCPMNAMCVAAWEGNARIQLLATSGRASEIIELNTNPMFDTVVVFDEHFIELQDLAPEFPWMPRGPLEQYSATLLVDGRAVPGI